MMLSDNNYLEWSVFSVIGQVKQFHCVITDGCDTNGDEEIVKIVRNRLVCESQVGNGKKESREENKVDNEEGV